MTSRERILSAAIPVFARKGRFGAHMEDIAALAHINKAMIYYIFHSKDELYLEVVRFVLEQAALSFSNIELKELKNRDDYIEFISDYIKRQINYFDSNRIYNKIMVDAMSNGAEEIPLAIQSFKENNNNRSVMSTLEEIILKGIAEGYIREIDVEHFMINIIGMITIYFQSQSMTAAMDLEIKDEADFIRKRVDSIIDLVINSILLPPVKKRKSRQINSGEKK